MSIEDLLEFIGEKTSSPQATQNLQGQIEFLTQQCDVVLSQSNPLGFGEPEVPVFEPCNTKSDAQEEQMDS